MNNDITTTQSVRDLRRRWKPHKERLLKLRPDNPTSIRFHRACSWLNYVEKMGGDPDYDVALIAQWIAFNALYGQWNVEAHEPVPDRECWRVFLQRIVDLDADRQISGVLVEHKKLVVSLFEDKYLSKFFWKYPEEKRAGQSKKAKYDARSWYVAERWGLILERVMDRIYLIRCQLVHGAATHGGKLNRTSLRHCSTMMGYLLRAILLVTIDHGADEDWGIMCYPPMQ
jgi:hypothetical protein